MKIQTNSIVSYYTPSLDLMIGVVAQTGDFNEANYGKKEPASRVYFGGSKYIVISDALLKVVNNNFVDAKDYVSAYTAFSELYNKHVDDSNAVLMRIAGLIKPTEIKKEWQFNSHYTPSGFKISVGIKLPKKYFKIGVKELTPKEIEALNTIVNTTIAGFEINNTTMKIHDIIGSKSVIQEALKYYYSL